MILSKKSKKNKKMNWQAEVIIFAGLIIFVLMIFFTVKAYYHYTELESHRKYFMQQNAPIQDWMTIRSIVRQYNLTESVIYEELNVTPGTIVEELGVDDSILVDRMTIQTICVKKHLDCSSVVNRLNSIRK